MVLAISHAQKPFLISPMKDRANIGSMFSVYVMATNRYVVTSKGTFQENATLEITTSKNIYTVSS